MRMRMHMSRWAALSPRLLDACERIATLARLGQLVLFLGSGTSVTSSMPSWCGSFRTPRYAHVQR